MTQPLAGQVKHGEEGQVRTESEGKGKGKGKEKERGQMFC
jgi:hypothetical protein